MAHRIVELRLRFWMPHVNRIQVFLNFQKLRQICIESQLSWGTGLIFQDNPLSKQICKILVNTINYMCYFYISHTHTKQRTLTTSSFLKKPNTKLWLPDSIVYFSKATSMYPSEQSWKMLVWKIFWGMGSIPPDRKLSKWLLNVSIDNLIGISTGW